MKNRLVAIAVLFLCSVGVQAQIDRSTMPEPGPAPKIHLGEPDSFTLDNGLKVLIVEDHKLPRVNVVLTMDNPPHADGEEAGISGILGSMLGEGTAEIPKDKFHEEVDYLGASINFNSNGASANTLSKYFPRILELMAKGALKPRFTEEQFELEKKRTLTSLKASEKDVATNARRLSSALTYGKDHPYGEFYTEESIKGLDLEEVKSYYQTYFVPQNAYLVVMGDVEKSEVKDLVKQYFTNWEKNPLPEYNMPPVENVDETQINFVNFPNAVQSEIQVVNTIDLQMGDPDYFPVLIANKILGGGGSARLYLNLREDKAFTYGAYSRAGTDKYVSRFVANASVRNEVTDSAVVAFLDELYRIRQEPVTKQELESAKAKFTGDFVLALERPSTIAQYALNIETEDLDEDFYENYLRNIEAVTIEDIHRVAQKYFLPGKARIIVVGKGSEVAEGLENLTYNGEDIAIKYFDKDANPIEKPVFEKAIPEGVTSQSVLNDYIEAIGGKAAVEDVESIVTIAQASVGPQTIDLETKVTAEGKLSNIVSMGGNALSKQVFDGETGYVMARGQKMPLTEEQIAAFKAEAHPFPELTAQKPTLLGIESVDGKDAYVVSFVENTNNYYDVETGLKLKSVKTVSQGAQTMSVPTTFSNYKEVEGIKFPFTITSTMGPQKIEFNVSEIKINEGVSDADFE